MHKQAKRLARAFARSKNINSAHQHCLAKRKTAQETGIENSSGSKAAAPACDWVWRWAHGNIST
jgi:hypothetical protein